MTRRAVVVASEPCYVEALAAKAKYLRRRDREWWRTRHNRVKGIADPGERRQALAELYAERDRLRLAGELFDSASAIVAHYLRAELIARGWWDKRWPAPRRGLGAMPGRRWGSPDNPNGPSWQPGRDASDHDEAAPDTSWSARKCVSLDPGLVDRLQRATLKVSEPATRLLQAGIRPGGGQRVVTTGEVLRAVLIRATGDWFPNTLGDPNSSHDAAATG